MGESKTWRLKDVAGAVYEVPAPIRYENGDREPYWCMPGEPTAGFTAHRCVVEWGYTRRIEVREIAEPGQLFASEQVAAMFARCHKIVWEETEYAHNVASRALQKLDEMGLDQ